MGGRLLLFLVLLQLSGSLQGESAFPKLLLHHLEQYPDIFVIMQGEEL